MWACGPERARRAREFSAAVTEASHMFREAMRDGESITASCRDWPSYLKIIRCRPLGRWHLLTMALHGRLYRFGFKIDPKPHMDRLFAIVRRVRQLSKASTERAIKAREEGEIS